MHLLALRLLLLTGGMLALIMLGTGIARRRAAAPAAGSPGWLKPSYGMVLRTTNAWILLALAFILITVSHIHREDAFLDGLAVAFSASERDPERRVKRIGEWGQSWDTYLAADRQSIPGSTFL